MCFTFFSIDSWGVNFVHLKSFSIEARRFLSIPMTTSCQRSPPFRNWSQVKRLAARIRKQHPRQQILAGNLFLGLLVRVCKREWESEWICVCVRARERVSKCKWKSRRNASDNKWKTIIDSTKMARKFFNANKYVLEICLKEFLWAFFLTSHCF